MKDRRRAEGEAGGAYELKCNDCDSVYVGETGRQLKMRMNEHRGHCRDLVHTFDFDSVSVLARQQNVHIRKQLESSLHF